MLVVLLHGFTQTGRSWDRIADALRASGHDVAAPDLPGHGGRARVEGDCTQAAAEVVSTIGGRPAAWVGYSMGGRVALHAAAAGAHVDRLVLLGAHPGIEDAGEREARRAADDALADRIEAIGVDAFLHEWLAQPLFARLPRDAASVDDRRRNTPEGLAGALRALGTGRQQPQWGSLARDVPTLVLAGELDGKYVDVGRRLAAAIGPAATFATVAGAGHAAHLERPDAFVDLVLPFLDG